MIWHGVGTETGSAPRTGREVGLLSCHQYPIKYHSDPLKQGDAQNFIQFPGLQAPARGPKRPNSRQSVTPSRSEGWDSLEGSGSPAPPHSLPPRPGTQALPPG